MTKRLFISLIIFLSVSSSLHSQYGSLELNTGGFSFVPIFTSNKPHYVLRAGTNDKRRFSLNLINLIMMDGLHPANYSLIVRYKLIDKKFQLKAGLLRGLVAAGLLAALMSSLASVFNSCSTLFTVDVYKKLRPDSSEKNLVRIGQIATAVAVIIGIIWIPIMQNISGVLYEYLQKVQSYIAPPITAVFLLGIFIKRVNKQGAFYTLISGLVIATLRIVLELVKDQLDPQGVLYFLGNLNYLVFGAYFFLLSIVLLIVISLLTAAPRYETIENLTFSTLTEEAKKSNKNSYNYWDIIITISVVLVVGGVMYFFNGS